MPEAVQHTTETDEKKSRGFGRYMLWAFVGLIVYVLSSGPALRFAVKTGGAHPVLQQIYAPMDWLNDNETLGRTLGQPFRMYWHIWCPEQYDKDGEEIP